VVKDDAVYLIFFFFLFGLESPLKRSLPLPIVDFDQSYGAWCFGKNCKDDYNIGVCIALIPATVNDYIRLKCYH
jgi:hypothetical protein